ncbi:MAG: ankyrin repeat domain-containing protein [Alphaproteobacteria bacterium]|nr:ankyrin repeat domain-containing protein [Alphaproteobacteria bacterium]
MDKTTNNKTLINQLLLINGKWKFFCAALALMYAGNIMAVGEDYPNYVNSENFDGADPQFQNSSKQKSYNISEEEYKNLLKQLRKNDTSSISDLVKKGVDFSQTKYHGYEALFCAIYFENEDLVKTLVEHGVDINYKMELFSTPLMRAILDQKQKMIECLVKYGADVNLRAEYHTPLTQIAGGFYPVLDQKKAIKYLVEHGADINKSNKAGKTPLMIAIEYFDSDLVKFLIELGADVNKADDDGNTPLSITTGRKFQQNMHQYLMDVITTESEIKQRNEEIRNYLISKGATGSNSTDSKSEHLQ